MKSSIEFEIGCLALNGYPFDSNGVRVLVRASAYALCMFNGPFAQFAQIEPTGWEGKNLYLWQMTEMWICDETNWENQKNQPKKVQMEKQTEENHTKRPTHKAKRNCKTTQNGENTEEIVES